MNRNHNQPDRRFFTLVELLVVIAIIAILMTILLPALRKSLDLGKKSACANKMKQLTAATIFYANDYDEYMPRVLGPSPWIFALRPYLGLKESTEPGADLYPEIYECPSHPHVWKFNPADPKILNYTEPSYGGNCHLLIYSFTSGPHPNWVNNPAIGYTKLPKIRRPSEKIIFGESKSKYEGNADRGECLMRDSSDPNRYAQARHLNSGNLSFADGAVKSYRADDLFNMQNSLAQMYIYCYPYE